MAILCDKILRPEYKRKQRRRENSFMPMAAFLDRN
jgi:hypothetical protein